VGKKCRHCGSEATDGKYETVMVSNCPRCEFHESGLIEHRIARWRNQSFEEEEEPYVDLICEAEEAIRKMRAKIERLESRGIEDMKLEISELKDALKFFQDKE